MTHERLLSTLADAIGPKTTLEISASLGLPGTAEDHALVEIVASLSPDLRRQASGWLLRADTPARRILTALRAYSDANPSKTVFRVASALGDLPAQDQPTEEQLRELLATSSDFRLMPNATIKRVS